MKSRLLIIVCLLFSFNNLFSQNKADLLRKREELLKELSLSSKLLEETTKKRGSTVEAVKLIESKIRSRNTLISNYKNEISMINKKVDDRKETIKQLEISLEEQKKLYAEILRYSYKNYNYYTKAVYLLASENLSQFYLRKKYLQQLEDARKEKEKLIIAVQNQIKIELVLLDEDKKNIMIALDNVSSENNKLQYERSNKEKFILQLQDEEKSLRKVIEEKRAIEEQISKEIEKLIAKEAKKDRYTKMTPEQQLVSDSFEKNKGKLPWPTKQGIITEGFGEHYHQVLKNVKVRNNGIDISTPKDTQVRSIFQGTVSKVFAIKGSNSTIIIRHGNYYTVYHNIVDVQVKVGDNIMTKSVIGKAGTLEDSNSGNVHFEVWKGLEKLDPQVWITQ